ncbi:MAG: glycosyltransferase [Bdellovibrio sp.]
MKKHIVFITEHLSFGGAEVVLATYIRTIDLNRYKVSLILRDDLGMENYLLKEIPPEVSVRYIFSQGSKPNSVREMRSQLVKRMKVLLKEIGSYDLLIDFSPVLDKVIPQLRDEKIVLWMHGDKSHMGFCERWKYFWRIRHYKKIVLLCPEMVQQFNTLFPMLRDHFVLIPNLFDFQRIHEKADDESSLSSEEQESLRKDYIISVARLVPGKDVRSLIEAAKINKERGVRYLHYIIGDGDMYFELRKLIEDYQLGDMVVLLGAKKNPYPWIKKAQFFVHSAIREGFGLVIVEAMSLGKAVVATKCPVGPSDILEHGKYGLMYELKDAQKLADHIRQYISDMNSRAEYALLAKKRAQEYSRERVIPLVNNLFDSF